MRIPLLRRPWVVVHESVDLHLARPSAVDGIPTTGLARLAMDLGAVVSFQRCKRTIREWRHGHGVSREELLHTYLRHKERGRNGGGALRDWLDRSFDVSGVSESHLMVAIEIDGAQHGDLDIAHRDQRRTELLEALGWTVLRVRSSSLASALAAVVHALGAACRRSVVD